jgi:hypothetical protein
MLCLSIQIFLRSRITYKKGWWPKKQIWRTHLLGAAMALTCASAARSVLEPEVAHQQEGCHQSAKMFPASGSSLIEDAPHVHVQEIATSGLHLKTALAAGWRYERLPNPPWFVFYSVFSFSISFANLSRCGVCLSRHPCVWSSLARAFTENPEKNPLCSLANTYW